NGRCEAELAVAAADFGPEQSWHATMQQRWRFVWCSAWWRRAMIDGVPERRVFAACKGVSMGSISNLPVPLPNHRCSSPAARQAPDMREPPRIEVWVG